jgi:Na+/H+-translocating membrane pyrophosphatase
MSFFTILFISLACLAGSLLVAWPGVAIATWLEPIYGVNIAMVGMLTYLAIAISVLVYLAQRVGLL